MRLRTIPVVLLCVALYCSCRPQERAGAEPRTLATTRDLSVDERRGGHTLQRHVGQTDEQLRQRLQREPNIPAASTYTDRATAERAVGAALRANSEKVNQWIRRGARRPNLALDYTESNELLGRVMFRGARGSVPCDHVVTILRAFGAEDYFVLTSYPECQP